MADYWTTPKINWLTSDGIGYEDLNRIEANISGNRDANFRKVQGFGYTVDNTVVGEDGVITIAPGSCYSENGYPIKMAANFVKNLTTWAAGNGAAFGGMAAAVTPAADTWYYAFVIMDPTDGSTEIMIDDDPTGANISSGTYTEKRFINSFKTAAAGGDGSFDLVGMFSMGNDVFIYPNSMDSGRYVVVNNSVGDNNGYQLIGLTIGSTGFVVPSRAVKAMLSIEHTAVLGLMSTYLSTPTDPGTLYTAPGPGAVPKAEIFNGVISGAGYVDASLMISATGQLRVALYDSGTEDGLANIAVRGYHDERLI